MPWICPNCNRSFKTTNQWHSCRLVDLDSHSFGKSEGVIAAFERLLEKIEQIGPHEVSPLKSSIQFKAGSTFCSVKLGKSKIAVEFFLEKEEKDPAVEKHFRISAKRVVHLINIFDPESIDKKLIEWIKRSYRLVSKKE